MKHRRIYTAGCFDLFHYGHLNILQKAKAQGDYLIVAVSSSRLMKQKGKVEIIPFRERVKIVESVKCVDKVVREDRVFDIKQFTRLKCDLFVMGSDWEERMDISNLNWLRASHKIVFFPYTKHLSSSEIQKKIIKNSYKIVESQVRRKSR